MMEARIEFTLWVLLATAAVTCTQQLDPIVNMCVRFDHQSVLKNNTLYIDGGRETFIDVTGSGSSTKQTGGITEGYNNYLIAIDLSSSWDWKTNISEKALTKNKVPATGTYPPILSRGALYRGADSDDNIYLMGGTTSYFNTSFADFRAPYPSQYSLWSYNITSGSWGQYDVTFGSPNRPNSGSSTEASDQGLAFFFNGQLDSGSEESTTSLGNDGKIFIEGMIVVDTNNQTARNLSTQAVVGNIPRSRGRMQYIGKLGGKGILVQIGGNQKNMAETNNSYIGDLVPMDQIDIFDVSSLYNASTPDGTWYKQNTSGDKPDGRIDFCVVLASSADGSSHNIYLYGGRGINSTTNVFYDDIWVLSIPSFTWTKIYQGTSPRYGHTCHLVGPRTMLTVGGAENYNYNQTPCDWETKGVGVFDMSDLEWGSVFNANAENYSVPNLVAEKIGGLGNGGATMKQPKGGFDQEGLAAIFKTPSLANGTSDSGNGAGKPPAGSNATAPRPTLSSSKPVVASIVGGVIGGLALIGLVASLLWYYRHQVKRILIGKDIFPFLELGEGREKAGAEMPVNDVCWELSGAGKPVEMLSPSEGVRGRVEMEAKRRNEKPIELPSPCETVKRAPVRRDKPLPIPKLQVESPGGSCRSESERDRSTYARSGSVGAGPVDETTWI